MPRWDNVGLFWQDLPATRKGGERTLGPMPPIPETGWRPPSHFPNIIDAPWIAIDCETYDPELNDYGPGWARGKGHIVGVSICTVQGKWYFPIRHEVQKEMNLDPDLVLRWLRYSLAGRQPKIGANIIYDLGWLRQEGVIVNGPIYDVQYAEPLLDETAQFSLDQLGWRYLKRGKLKDELKEWAQDYYGKSDVRWREDIYRCPVSLVGPYAEDDAEMPYQILMQQWPKLQSRGLLPLFEMECKLIRLLLDMRFAGISVDIPYAERLRDDLLQRGEATMKEAEHIAGMSFNPNSAQQLAEVFDRLGLYYPRTAPTEKNPDGNPSFTKDYLKTLKHPFVARLQKIRELEKLRSTFVEGYILSSHVNGKVFGSFHPLRGESGGAKTGRFSSSDPNLQNIPVRTAEGKIIRQAFICDDGHRQFRAYDYSQIEYRFLAHFATGEGADSLRSQYTHDASTDFHDMCRDMIIQHTGIELERSYVKNINFGLTYGMGLEHLAEGLGVPPAEAKSLIESYHNALPFAKATMKATVDEIQESGICRTILNRQTHFDMWEPAEWGKRDVALPYRAALAEYGANIIRAYAYKGLNYKLQGSAGDLMKAAMVANYEAGVFDEIGVPRMTVHDELGFSDHGEAREEAWEEMRHICETCIDGIRVPIKMEGKSGAHWGECK
ncbi:DNA polymerase A [Synechococcus phage Ssp-JY38]|nr:DNA polymerase I [Synechococcus phage Yong-L2-223]